MFQHMAKFLSLPFLNGISVYNLRVLKQRIHLKRVIVTPAVYQLLAPLERGLKYWHWAGITFYSQPYGLAEC